jgi:hypothetical protein
VCFCRRLSTHQSTPSRKDVGGLGVSRNKAIGEEREFLVQCSSLLKKGVMITRIIVSLALFCPLAWATTGCAEQGPASPVAGSFQECVAEGGMILKSYPAQCVSKNGDRFFDKPIAKPARVCTDNCGNGVCEEIVCMALGCPCAESQTSCPKDCSTDAESIPN